MATDTSFLKKRRQTWYAQIPVPRDVQLSLGKLRRVDKPVKVIVQSLKTRDKSEAQRLRWEKHREALELFDRLRGKKTLTLAEIEETAEATFRGFLKDAEEAAKQGAPLAWGGEAVSPDSEAESPASEYGGLDTQLDLLQEALHQGDYSPVTGRVKDALQRAGAEVVIGSRIYVELCESQLRALIEATAGRLAFLRGEEYEPKRPFTSPIVDPLTLSARHPVIVRKRTATTKGEKFSDASARYVSEMMRDVSAAWTMQTKQQTEATFRLFGDYLNGAPVPSINSEDAAKFLDAISSLHPDYGRSASSKGLSLSALLETYSGKGSQLTNKTLNRHATALSGFFKWAKKNGLYIGDNPFSGLLRQTGRKSGWLPLNNEELKKLVNAPLLLRTPFKDRVYPANHNMNVVVMWAPLIALFSGLRSEEICQLRWEDVKCEGSIWYFNVAEENGKRVKTEAGIRRVPVHSELIGAGLLEYVKHVKGHHSGQLFPGLNRGGPDKKFNWYFTKRAREHFNNLGIVRDRVTFHSLRKNVGTALERARVPESEAVQVLGHEKMSMSYSIYSLGLDLQALRDVVEKINYPEVSLAPLSTKN